MSQRSQQNFQSMSISSMQCQTTMYPKSESLLRCSLHRSDTNTKQMQKHPNNKLIDDSTCMLVFQLLFHRYLHMKYSLNNSHKDLKYQKITIQIISLLLMLSNCHPIELMSQLLRKTLILSIVSKSQWKYHSTINHSCNFHWRISHQITRFFCLFHRKQQNVQHD